MADLTPERWQQIDTLFDEALERPVEERTAFLRQVCGDDPELYGEVARLLESIDRAETVLGESVTEFAAPLLAGLESDLRSRDPHHEMPDAIGPYRVLAELGRGGMGTVYLAERADGQFERKVALKLVKRGMDTDEILRRFRHERQILASLQHPNIARLYDGGVAADGRPYIAMEYVDGTPIDRYCNEKELTVDQRLRLFTNVCDAVSYAHQNLVVHRDLKPSNILVSDDGSVKLLDFGIAKLLSDDDGMLTRTGVRVMTPQYAAPEQTLDKPVTTATDVYALGVILYEILTGYRPRSAEKAATGTTPARPSTLVSKPQLGRRLQGDLDTILLKSLRAEPERRYATADAFVEDIKRHLAGFPVSAQPDRVAYRLRKFVSRHRFGVATATGFLMLVTGFGVFYTAQIAGERNAALRERDKAEEVAAFLEAIFDASDPFAPERLDTLRVVDLLQRGARQVDEALSDEPLVRAQMQTVLGHVYNRLGLNDQSAPVLEDALAVRVDRLGPDHILVAETMIELADLEYDVGNYIRAESLAVQALKIVRAEHGPRHETVAEAMHLRGLTLHALGRLREAESDYRTALELRRELQGEMSPEVAAGLSTLAWLRSDQGDNVEAEQLYRESVALRRAVYGDRHPSTAVGLNNLAVLLRDIGRYDEAEEYIREALDINRSALGPDHDHVVDNLNVLASILRGQGEYAEADPIYEQVLDVRRRTLGPDHPRVSITLDGYAGLKKAQGLYQEAEVLEREAIAIARKAYGDEHFGVVITTSRLAGIVHESGDAERALPIYREALDLAERVFDADHVRVVALRSELGACLTSLDRFEEAEPLVTQAYRSLADSQGEENSTTDRALRNVIQLYEEWGRPDETAAYRSLATGTD